MNNSFLKKTLACSVFSVMLTLSASQISFAQSASAPKAQENCPVMGGKINHKVFADYKGKRVYFCCPGCIAKFKQDPEKYIKALEAEGVQIDVTPAN